MEQEITNTHALWAWSVNHVFLLSLLASVPSDFTHRVELLSAVVHSPGSESFARISLLLLLGGGGEGESMATLSSRSFLSPTECTGVCWLMAGTLPGSS